MKRRRFIARASMMAGATFLSFKDRTDRSLTDRAYRPRFAEGSAKAQQASITDHTDRYMGVLGPIKGDDLGVTLVHEHVMADFIGAAETGPHRYKVEDVVAKAKPFLVDLKKAGCNTFVDCTPVYLGRDVQVLKQLATETGMNILTTTGYYGAVEEIFLPEHAYTETIEQLSARWVNESKNGIDDNRSETGTDKNFCRLRQAETYL